MIRFLERKSNGTPAGVPNNKFKGFRLRSDAIKYFKEHDAKREACVILVDDESEEIDK